MLGLKEFYIVAVNSLCVAMAGLWWLSKGNEMKYFGIVFLILIWLHFLDTFRMQPLLAEPQEIRDFYRKAIYIATPIATVGFSIGFIL